MKTHAFEHYVYRTAHLIQFKDGTAGGPDGPPDVAVEDAASADDTADDVDASNPPDPIPDRNIREFCLRAFDVPSFITVPGRDCTEGARVYQLLHYGAPKKRVKTFKHEIASPTVATVLQFDKWREYKDQNILDVFTCRDPEVVDLLALIDANPDSRRTVLQWVAKFADVHVCLQLQEP